MFSLLTPDELKTVNATRCEVKFSAGETIFKQGTAANYIVSFYEGMGKLYIEGINGKELIFRIVKPTELVGIPSAYTVKRHHFSMAALVDSQVCLIDLTVFKSIIRQNGIFAESFIEDFSKNILETHEKFFSITQKHMHSRMAEALLYLSKDIYETNLFDCALSRQELGDLTGLTKESAIRILKEFDQQSIIKLTGNRIEILSEKSLMHISQIG